MTVQPFRRLSPTAMQRQNSLDQFRLSVPLCLRHPVQMLGQALMFPATSNASGFVVASPARTVRLPR